MARDTPLSVCARTAMTTCFYGRAWNLHNIDITCFFSCLACAEEQDGTEQDEVISTCSKTADGNVVLTGLTQGDWVETNTGLWALVAVKLDVADGSVIWRYQVGMGGMAWCTLMVTRGRLVRQLQTCLIGCAWLRKVTQPLRVPTRIFCLLDIFALSTQRSVTPLHELPCM